jgi:trehalose 6-phosphate phosphatase
VTSVPSLLHPVVGRASSGGVLFDFDGTLSPIVESPSAARLLDGGSEILERLVARYKLVGVLSGRPVEFLAPLLPSGVVVAGLYGLEVLRDGTRVDHPLAGSWREAIEDVAQCSHARGPRGMHVESKGLSLTLHYRSHPEIAGEVEDWARSQAKRSGLVVRPARMSIELHPPINTDKGTALEALAEDLDAVCYLGDDVGDLPAFDALDRLAATGVYTVRVAVSSEESPEELLKRADLVLDGPDAVLRFLHSLLP